MVETQPFKAYLNAELAKRLAEQLKQVHAPFPVEAFVAQASEGLEALELKERTAHIAAALRAHLPADYPEAVKILEAILGPENEGEKGVLNEWYFLMPVAHFVERYGYI